MRAGEQGQYFQSERKVVPEGIEGRSTVAVVILFSQLIGAPE